MPQPQVGEIRHGRSGSVQWDGTGWESVDVPNPMSGDATAAKAEADASRGGDYFGNLLRGAGEALNPLNIPRAVMGLPKAAADMVEAGKEAISHPGEIGPAFENADPETVGGALGSLLGMGVGGRVVGAIGDHAPTVPTALRTAGKLGDLDITKPLALVKPVANWMADKLEPSEAPSMAGLKAAIDVPTQKGATLSGIPLSGDAVARNIDATNMRDMEGFSHSQAGKLAGIPGAGESTAVDVPMGEHAITPEMINEALSKKPYQPWNPEPDATTDAPDLMDEYQASTDTNPRQEMPPSMQGLQDAVAPVDPLRAARDEAVRKYLNKSPNSALSQLVR